MDAAALVDELRRTASEPRFSSVAEELTSIADEVEDDTADGWAAISLIDGIPPMLVVHSHDSRLEKVLAFAAIASVFFPVAWTWLSLRSAIGAYRQDLSSRTPSMQPFLAQWATGFDGHLKAWHRLDWVALVSVLLVVLAVLMLVSHRITVTSVDRAEAQTQTGAERDLHRVLVKAQVFLAPRRASDPKSIEAAIKRSVAELGRAHQSTREGLEQLSQLVGAANSCVAEMATLATTLGTALTNTDRLSTALTSAATDAAGIAKAAVTELAQSIDSSARSQKLLAGEVTLIAEHERTVRNKLDDAVAALAKALDSLSLEMTASQNASQASADELTRSRDAIEQLLHLLLQRSPSVDGSASLANP